MNIRAIANSGTSRVNPNVPVILLISGERVVSPDGTVTIPYTEVPAIAQMQPAGASLRSEWSQELVLTEGRSAGIVYKIFYVNGDLSGLCAPKSYDKIVAEGKIYKVISRPEGWNSTSGWSCVLGELEGDYDEESDSEPEIPGASGDPAGPGA